MKQIRALLSDMNLNEIGSQISSNNLGNWLRIWNEEMAKALDDLESRIVEDCFAYKPCFQVGDIIEEIHDVRAVIIDNGDASDTWFVLTENGCCEEWHESDFQKIGGTNLIKQIIEGMR